MLWTKIYGLVAVLMQFFIQMNTSTLKTLFDYDCYSPFVWAYPVFPFFKCYICIQNYYSYCPAPSWNCCFFFLIQFSKILINSYVWQSEIILLIIFVMQYTVTMIFTNSLGIGYCYILVSYISFPFDNSCHTVLNFHDILVDSLGIVCLLYILELYELYMLAAFSFSI